MATTAETFLDLLSEYWQTELGLGENYDLTRAYHTNLTSGQRVGQAFMNALPLDAYRYITGTFYDPFHSNQSERTHQAIDWLMLRLDFWLPVKGEPAKLP